MSVGRWDCICITKQCVTMKGNVSCLNWDDGLHGVHHVYWARWFLTRMKGQCLQEQPQTCDYCSLITVNRTKLDVSMFLFFLCRCIHNRMYPFLHPLPFPRPFSLLLALSNRHMFCDHFWASLTSPFIVVLAWLFSCPRPSFLLSVGNKQPEHTFLNF